MYMFAHSFCYAKDFYPLEKKSSEFLLAISGEKTRDTPYEIELTIPVEGYEPIQFTLAKMCRKNHTANPLSFCLSLSLTLSQTYPHTDTLTHTLGHPYTRILAHSPVYSIIHPYTCTLIHTYNIDVHKNKIT